MAAREGTSLNQFLLTAVAEKLGASEFCEKISKKLEDRIHTVAYLESRNLTVLAGPSMITGSGIFTGHTIPLEGVVVAGTQVIVREKVH